MTIALQESPRLFPNWKLVLAVILLVYTAGFGSAVIFEAARGCSEVWCQLQGKHCAGDHCE